LQHHCAVQHVPFVLKRILIDTWRLLTRVQEEMMITGQDLGTYISNLTKMESAIQLEINHINFESSNVERGNLGRRALLIEQFDLNVD